jgi:hypothetical protein
MRLGLLSLSTGNCSERYRAKRNSDKACLFGISPRFVENDSTDPARSARRLTTGILSTYYVRGGLPVHSGSLCALKRVAAKAEHARYGATQGIRISLASGLYRAEATDAAGPSSCKGWGDIITSQSEDEELG